MLSEKDLLNQDYGHYNGITRDLYRDKVLLRANPDGSRSSPCEGSEGV